MNKRLAKFGEIRTREEEKDPSRKNTPEWGFDSLDIFLHGPIRKCACKPGVCKVRGCAIKPRWGSLCAMHDNRWRRYGCYLTIKEQQEVDSHNPIPKERRSPTPEWGFDPLDIFIHGPTRERGVGVCRVRGCIIEPDGQGSLCPLHAARWTRYKRYLTHKEQREVDYYEVKEE